MGFLNSLAGATQGNQDYQAWQQQQAAQKQAMQYQQMQMQAYAQQQQQAQQQRQQQAQIAQGYVGMLGQQNQQIPPRPGEASQPQQPPQQMQQQPQQPTGLDLSKVDPRTQAFLAKQNPMAFAGGVQKFQQTSQIPPYQSMNQQPQQQAPQQAQIPEPPKYSLDVAVKKLQEQGIKDPEVILAILEKNQSRLDAEAKQKLAMLKEQELSEYHRSMIGERAATREQRAPLVEAQTNDYKGRTEDRPNRTAAITTNANARAGGASDESVKDAEKRLAVGQWIQNPSSLRGLPKNYQQNIIKWAAELNITPQDVASGQAVRKFDLAAAGTSGHRAGKMASVEQTMPGLISDAIDASKKVARGKWVPFTKVMQMGQAAFSDPDLRDFAIANQAVASEYQQVISRGGTNVTSLQEAMHLLETASSQESYERALNRVKKEVERNVEGSEKVRSNLSGSSASKLSKDSEGGMPKAGTVENGYRFKGGDPAKQENWEKQ